METRSKIETYIGFAFRAGKVRLGTNAIATLKKVKLLIVCKTASANCLNEAEKLARRFKAKTIMTNKKTVEELSRKENCKLMAITDSSLAKAILDNLNEDYTEYIWEAEKING